jgi:hypothetical protein
MSLDTFTLLLNNNPVNVISYTVKYDMFQGAGVLDAEIDPSIVIDLTAGQIQFEVRINDQAMMLGFLEKVNRTHSKGSKTQSVSGRDMMQVLIDNYIMQPQVYPGKPEAANSKTDLWGDSSQDASITIHNMILNVWNSSKQLNSTASVNEQGKAGTPSLISLSLPTIDFPQYADNAVSRKTYPIKKARTGHGQTMFEFFSQMLNSLGLYMYNVPGSNVILIHSIQSASPVVSYNKDCSRIVEEAYKSQMCPEMQEITLFRRIIARISRNSTSFYDLSGKAKERISGVMGSQLPI